MVGEPTRLELQAKLVKAAVSDALQQWKSLNPGLLMSPLCYHTYASRACELTERARQSSCGQRWQQEQEQKQVLGSEWLLLGRQVKCAPRPSAASRWHCLRWRDHLWVRPLHPCHRFMLQCLGKATQGCSNAPPEKYGRTWGHIWGSFTSYTVVNVGGTHFCQLMS